MGDSRWICDQKFASVTLRQGMASNFFIRQRIIEISDIYILNLLNNHIICKLRVKKGVTGMERSHFSNAKLQKNREKIWWNKKIGLTLHSQSGV
jgi:hypothetical protein